MKKILVHPLFIAIIPLVIGLLIPISLEFFQKSKSIYDISYMRGDKGSIGIIELKNRSNNIQNDLYFEIYSFEKISIEAEGIINYKITKSQNDSLIYILVVNNLLPEKTSKLLFFSDRATTEATFINSKAMNYFSENELALSKLNIWSRLLVSIIIMTFFSIILYFILSHFQKQFIGLRLEITTESSKQTEEYNKKYKEFNEKQKIFEDEFSKITNYSDEKMKEISKEFKSAFAKQRIIWLSKARAYQKELNFWKTIISKKLLEDKDLNPKELHKYVTNSLKTYETLVDIDKGLTVSELSYIDYIKELYDNNNKSDINI